MNGGGRCLYRNTVKPGLDLRPLPALVAVACQQPTQQQMELRVEVVRDRHAVCQYVDQEGIGIDATEAGTLRQLLEQNHAHAPPV
ncbi:hypothetical protein D3C81_1777200 [compost metagenome]